MGANLALNLADSGNTVSVYNRTTSVTEKFMAAEAATKAMIATETLEQLVGSLRPPRIVLLMVKAGGPVDAVIEELRGLLQPGDIIIDGGNSLHTDTERRTKDLSGSGLRFIGMGISGGEEGARHGPSLMPGGDIEAWPHVEELLKGIAAMAPDGTRCCDWVGPGGAGHFVKMVHNGIEYGDMQVIAEAYDVMRRGLHMTPAEMATVFTKWNEGRLRSYLIEITADILSQTEDGQPVIDTVLDAAGQKGTGKWTVTASMDLAEPTALVAEAVYARMVSADPARRGRAASILGTPTPPLADLDVSQLESALYAAKIISYAQGFRLLSAAAEEHDWTLDLGLVASLWRAGCIIRAVFLEDITAAYRADLELEDLATSPFFSDALREAEPDWRSVVAGAVRAGIPTPAYSSALAYFDGMRSRRLPADLIQAQRDYFGAHTFERVDRPRGEFFHREWH